MDLNPRAVSTESFSAEGLAASPHLQPSATACAEVELGVVGYGGYTFKYGSRVRP